MKYFHSSQSDGGTFSISAAAYHLTIKFSHKALRTLFLSQVIVSDVLLQCCCRCQVWKRSWSLNICVSLNSIFCNYYCMTQVQTKPGFEIFIYQPRANCLRWFMENISNLNKNWDSRHFLNPPLVLANCSQGPSIVGISISVFNMETTNYK